MKPSPFLAVLILAAIARCSSGAECTMDSWKAFRNVTMLSSAVVLTEQVFGVSGALLHPTVFSRDEFSVINVTYTVRLGPSPPFPGEGVAFVVVDATTFNESFLPDLPELGTPSSYHVALGLSEHAAGWCNAVGSNCFVSPFSLESSL